MSITTLSITNIAIGMIACLTSQGAVSGRVNIPLSSLTAHWVGASMQTTLSQGSTVTSWPDSSGNSNSATAGTGSPTFNLQTVSGKPGVLFTASNLLIPSGVSVSNRASTLCVISEQQYQPQSGTYSPISVGTLAVYGTNTTTTGLQYRANPGNLVGSSLLLQPASVVAQCVTYSATNIIMYRENGSQSFTAASAATSTGGFLGSFGASATFPCACTVLDAAVYSTALSAVSIRQFMQYAHDYYGSAYPSVTRQANVIAVGDSLTAGFQSTGSFTYPDQMGNFKNIRLAAWVQNAAVSGQTAATILTNIANVGALFNAAYTYNVVILFAGTNDLQGCTNTATCNAAEATLQTTTSSIVSDLHTSGFKVIVTTMITRGAQVAAFEVARQTFNTWLVTLSNSGADGLSNPGQSTDLGTLPQSATWFNADDVHLTNAGYQQLANGTAVTTGTDNMAVALTTLLPTL